MSYNNLPLFFPWFVSFSQNTGSVSAAVNGQDYILYKARDFSRPNGTPVKICSGHTDLFKALVTSADDLQKSPAKCWLSQKNLCLVCRMSRSDLQRKLKDLQDVGLLHVQRRSTTSNMMYLFFTPYDPLSVPSLTPETICFEPSYSATTNAKPRSRKSPELAKFTEVLVEVLQEKFPDHASVSSASQLKYLAINLQPGIEIAGSSRHLTHLLDLATDGRDEERTRLYESLANSKNLGNYLSKCVPEWLEKFGEELEAYLVALDQEN